MGLFSTELPTLATGVAMVVGWTCLYRAARRAPWKKLEGGGVFSAWCIFIICLPVLWSGTLPPERGIALHLLGMPLFVLMFGRQLAMIGLGIAVLAHTAMQGGIWANVGVNLLLMAVLPTWCSEAVMRMIYRFLPRHLFVYLLGNGFFGAMLMLVLIGMLSVAASAMLVPGPQFSENLIAYMLLLASGESFLTGFLLTMLTIYRPQWVLTFDDAVYLQNHQR